MDFNNTKCPAVFRFFEEMNQIPRGSGNEQAISDWLVQFAKERGLEVIQDKALNVIIKKPETAGYENARPVILQGHMDMVCEKEADKEHDFLKDPITLVVEGDKIHADRTTLGADNGIAVSYGLALLDSNDMAHPPIELLVTTSEETGMDGAFALDPSHLAGRRLINIDAEEEGKLLVSCAGGIGATISLPVERETPAAEAVAMELKIDGLLGGHSGMEINKQRGSANKLMGRILFDLEKNGELRLAALNGGSKHNAIPRSASAILMLLPAEVEAVKERIQTWTAVLANELQGVDEGLKITLETAAEGVSGVFTKSTTHRAIAILRLIPAGVINMSMAIAGLVQTSNNLGVVITEADRITFESAVRSSVRSHKMAVAEELEIIAELTGASIEYASVYPEWQYDPSSELRDAFVAVYRDMYQAEPEITAIHAGLECGLLSEKYDGNIDLISFGPNLYDVHTPQECMSISSVERTWEYLRNVLAKLNN
ncbi:aminoacyl-histidine dipeptidase [Proteiniclasticum sp. QWL-01]|uniref:aminoacyl-histidine dipeptidase n=1 Tax=Proteiniclasticum sp. QWL-01 TaxID=3036945 RepID=UPI0024114ADA|nr:aminoacyl-histidine dipeptidase [Proteiniclasticum sp. QWL-01]WFF73137.1 aminoacyl-histidine dipeptidase [Proteiniclasticum sp. QWL-01]